MRTATITWITYNNYGTELQAYALQQYIKGLGIENDIISDKYIVCQTPEVCSDEPISEKGHNVATVNKHFFLQFAQRVKKYIFHPIKIIKIIHNIGYNKKMFHLMQCYNNSQNLFSEFKDQYLDIVNGLRREDMTNLNSKYDVFICGSDQIWSVLKQNFDGYFFLDFAKGKKISYATSIGTEKIEQETLDKIAEWLNDFSSISVREKRTSEQLTKALHRDVEWVVDPTLLHNTKFWSDFCVDVVPKKKKYLLCYFLNNNEWYFNYAAKLAKHLHLNLLLIPSSFESTNKKGCYSRPVGPKEFVSLFKYASFVLTDSYHGSIFSLLFEKNFIHLKRFSDEDPICQNIRVYSLFEKINLCDHIVEKKIFTNDDVKPIEYNKINIILSELRKESELFIKKALVLS